MKIVQISPYPPAEDGIGNYTRSLSDELAKLGHEVRVVAARGDEAEAPREVVGTLDGDGAGLLALRERIADWQPDVVHVQFAVAAFGTRIRALMKLVRALHADGLAIVLTLHEITRDTALLGPIGRTLYRRVCALADKVIVHTAVAQLAVRGLDRDKPVQVLPHPVFRPRTAEGALVDLRAQHQLGDGRVLLAFGFVHVDKGLDVLVGALAALRSREPSAVDGLRLVVAGHVRPRRGLFRLMELRDRRHLAGVRRLVRRHGLTEHVTFTGYVPDEHVGGWFMLADAVVLPYRRIEQSGVASLAEAFGAPVLCSDVGGLAEQFAGTPWLFPAGDTKALAGVLSDFLAAPRSITRAVTARRRALPVVARQTVSLYKGQFEGCADV